MGFTAKKGSAQGVKMLFFFFLFADHGCKLVWIAQHCGSSAALRSQACVLWKLLRNVFLVSGPFSPHFGAISLLNYTVNLEKREKIHWRNFKKSSGEASLKLQISVPCRGRMCPDGSILLRKALSC